MLIVIEGCVGAGKTTVATGLAKHRKCSLLLEDFESNPFLRAFYEDPIENAVETEFAFLLLHFHQLRRHSQLSLNSEIVSDFHLVKDLLYANVNLMDRGAKTIFAELYEFCSKKISPAALLIFLSASTELLVRRIAERNRSFELAIDRGYYAKVNQAYEDFFGTYRDRKLRICMDDWDFVKDPGLYEQLAVLVNKELDAND
jgi:deoxyadenosine/deoxycytidine kinase